MVPVYSDCEIDLGETHEGEKGEPHISSILASRFSPFNFSAIVGYPHPIPDRDEWMTVFRDSGEASMMIPVSTY
jgi:hypothetical protein